jgi:uncharacterized delta-60 repeat protein
MWAQVPTITSRPLSRAVVEGESINFTVAATGAAPLTYTWRHQGTVLSESSNTLTLENAALTDRGWYHVTVNNPQGSATSVLHLQVGIDQPTWVGWGQAPTIPVNANNPPLFLDSSAFYSYVLGLNRDGTVSGWSTYEMGQTEVPAGLTDVVNISAGGDAMAVKADGSVVTWPNSSEVPAGLNDVVATASGLNHVLALHANGTVTGWGVNNSGDLNIPAAVQNAVAVAAGSKHSLALLADGSVVGWGSNNANQTTIPAGLSNVIAIDAGYSMSLALRAEGTVVAWGQNYSGSTEVPTGLEDAVAVASGATHNVILRADGTVVAFGRPYEDQIAIPAGLSQVTNVVASGSYSGALVRTLPPSINLQPLSQSLTAGDSLTLSVSANGTVPMAFQWKRDGNPLTNGGTVTGATSSTLVLSDVTESQAGSYTVEISNPSGLRTSDPAVVTVATPPLIVNRPLTRLTTLGEPLELRVELVDPTGTTFEWKHNGRVISGVVGNTLSLAAVNPSDRGAYHVTITRSGISQTTLFYLHVGPKTAAETIAVSWGQGSRSDLTTPPELTDVVAVSAGNEHALALRANGTVSAWGVEAFGRTIVPAGLDNVVAIAAGQYNSAALTADGRVTSWGSYSSYDWTVPNSLNRVVAMDGYENHLVLLTEDGKVTAIGSTPPAQLGDVIAVAAGRSHGLALKADGSVVQWGSIPGGVLAAVPNDLGEVIAIAAGFNHCLALRSDGTVVAWGQNDYGQTIVPAGLSGVVAIEGGSRQSVALLADGKVVAWGNDLYGKTSDTAKLDNVFALSAGDSFGFAVTARSAPELVPAHPTYVGSTGETLTLKVAVSGAPAPTLQWYLANQPVPGATSATLTLPNLQSSSAGTYHVVAINASGSITSAPIQVSVVSPLTIHSRPLSQLAATGENVSFSFQVAGQGTISYRWRRDGEVLADQTSATLNFPAVALTNRGRYEVTATDAVGASATSVCYLRVSAPSGLIIGWGGGRVSPATGPTGFEEAAAVDAGGFPVALGADGTPIAWGNFSESPPSGLSGLVAVAAGDNHALGLRADGTVVVWGSGGYGETDILAGLNEIVAVAADGYNSLALKADGTVVHWGYNPYGYQTVPVGLDQVVAIAAGRDHGMALRRDGSVVAWGDGLAGTSPANGGPAQFIAAGYRSSMMTLPDGSIQIWGELSQSTTTIPQIADISIGSHQALVVDTTGHVTALGGNFTGTANAVPIGMTGIVSIAAGNGASYALSTTPPGPPVIVTDLANQTAAWGDDVTLSIAATGTPVLSFTWKKDDEPMGITTPTLQLAEVKEENAGTYTVVITNAFGTVTSTSAQLSVVVTDVVPDSPPVVGGSTELTIRQAPTATAYQWRFRGLTIDGATGPSLQLRNLSRDDNGLYDVVMTLANGETRAAHAFRLDVAPRGLPDIYSVDTDFAPRFEQAGAGQINAVLPLLDGGFLVGGEFIRLDETERMFLARFNADGTFDADATIPEFSGPVRALAAAADGKIYVGGDFSFIDQVRSGGIVRLTADLQVDSTFPVGRGFNNSIHALAVQPDGKIVVGGDFNWYDGAYSTRLARLHPDATLDSSFSYNNTIGPVRVIHLQGDGKIVAGGGETGDGSKSPSGFIIRVTANNGNDWDWGSNGFPGNGLVNFNWTVLQLKRLAGGGWMAAGGNVDYVGGAQMQRLTDGGITDPSFTLSSAIRSSTRMVNFMRELPDGRFLIAGGNLPARVLNADGSAAVTIPSNPWLDESPTIATTVGDRSLRLWGRGTPAGGTGPRLGSAVFDSSSLSFGSLTGAEPFISAPLYDVQTSSPDHLLVRGGFTHVNGQPRQGLARITLAGTLDNTFTVNTSISLSDTGRPVRLGDGRLLVHDGSLLRRLHANGTVDSTFVSPTYQAGAIGIGPGGETIIANGAHGGHFGSTYGLIRLSENGSIDPTFAPDFSGQPKDIITQSNGRFVLFGYFSRFEDTSVNGAQRIRADGSWDPSFQTSYIVPYRVAATTDDRIYMIDQSSSGSTVLFRALATGRNDLLFQFSRQLRPTGITPLPFENFLASFNTTTDASAGSSSLVRRFFENGTEDTAFRVNGLDAVQSAITQTLLTDDGSILAVGNSLSAFGKPRSSLIKLTAAAPLSITTAPTTAVATPGGQATLSVVAEGSGPITYQWYRNRVAIAGATTSALELSNLSLADVDFYHVAVSHPFANLASQPVTLTGPNPAPTITAQPASLIATSGERAALAVTANGVGELTYQWRRSNHPIPGANAATYIIPNARRADAGIYDVLVADGLSVTVSDGVRLDVAPARYPEKLALDPAFAPRFEIEGGAINALLPTGDGKFIVSGDFTQLNGVSAPGLARVNADFSVDTTFVPSAMFADVAAFGLADHDTTRVHAVLPDGKLLVTHALPPTDAAPYRNELVRLLPDGTIDVTFQASAEPLNVRALTLQPDGRIIVVAVWPTSLSLPASKRFVYRLQADGSWDETYAPQFRNDSNPSYPSGLLATPDGKTLFVGNFNTVNGVSRPGIVRLDASGMIDENFAPQNYSVSWAEALKRDAAGKLWIGGTLSDPSGNTIPLARVSADGAWEAGLLTSTDSSEHVSSVQFDGTDRVWAGSRINSYTMKVWRMTSAGTTEQRFESAFTNRTSAFVPQPDGGVWMTGTVFGQPEAVVMRFTPDGTLGSVAAETMTSAGVTTLALAADGTLFAAGEFTQVNGVPHGRLARLLPNGELDPEFNPSSGFNAIPTALEPLPNGQLIVGGTFNRYRGQLVAEITRLETNGELDPTFAPADSGYSGWFGGKLELLSDGRLLVDGHLCLLSDGTTDTTWTATIRNPNTMIAQANGDVLVSGYIPASGQYIRRLSPYGTTLVNGYTGHNFRSMFILPDGKVLTGGKRPTAPYWNNFADVRRLNTDLSQDNTYATTGLPAPLYATSSYTGPTLLGQEDGRVILDDLHGMWRLNPDGSRDPKFVQEIATASTSNSGSGFASKLLLDDGRLMLANPQMSLAGYRHRGIVVLRSEDTLRIVEHPTSQTVIDGETLTLAVTVAQPDGLTFQWFKDGVAIDGSIAATFEISPATLADAGAYHVVITSPQGTTQSAVAHVTVTPATAPMFTLQPRDQSGASGSMLTLTTQATGAPTPTLQWQYNGTDLPGATSATLTLTDITTTDSGTFTVVATNRVGNVTSASARVTVYPTGMTATQTLQDVSLASGSITLEIANHFASPENVTRVDWQVLLPTGWSFVSGVDDDTATFQPTVDDTDLLEWSWTTGTPNALDFRYSLEKSDHPGSDDALVSLLTITTADATTEYLVQPDPLPLRPHHSADTDGDNRLSLRELLRVIELYNTRFGTTRSGRYRVQSDTADGFTPDAESTTTTPTRFHAADMNRDGQIGLSELLRVIELYNTRSGTTRTGRYRVQPDTADGFSPDI